MKMGKSRPLGRQRFSSKFKKFNKVTTHFSSDTLWNNIYTLYNFIQRTLCFKLENFTLFFQPQEKFYEGNMV